MTKEKLAIISSYSEMCGNASYTKALADSLSFYYEVSIIPLNVELFRKGEAKLAELHIEKICNELKNFDCVNIQFEAALFGANIKDIKKRFFKIAKSSKKLLLTMHRYHPKDRYLGLNKWVKHLVKFEINKIIEDLMIVYRNNRYVPLYYSIISFCKKNTIPILVHTHRDQEAIKIKFDYLNVFGHPICYYDQTYIESLKNDNPRENFLNKLSLEENKTYIGIFGLIGGYKGCETIIQALQYLPANYELLILGSQHPHTIQQNVHIDPYILSLVKLIEKMNLTKRVKFHRLATDEDFLKAMLGCDFNVLPYLEVKQGGSAVAALSLETGAKAIFSQNFAFFELEKYAVNAFKMFSIGNYLELANAILSYRQLDFAENLKIYHQKYNIRTSAALYHKLLSQPDTHPVAIQGAQLCIPIAQEAPS